MVLPFCIILLRPLYQNTICKQQTFIFHNSRGWEVQDQGAADLMSGEGPPPSLHMVAFLLDLHMVERDLVSSYKDASLFMGHRPHDIF